MKEGTVREELVGTVGPKGKMTYERNSSSVTGGVKI